MGNIKNKRISASDILEETWRWFGPSDPISLDYIRQSGATGIVTALHHIPNGEVWTVDEIEKRNEQIKSRGLRWSVVESVPVHENIKTQSGDFQRYIDNYKESLANLALCGIKTVCYNFMPVLDWTRTDLNYSLPDGSQALRLDMKKLAAFDIFILQRKEAEKDYEQEVIQRAGDWFWQASPGDKEILQSNILAGLPGAEEHYTLSSFRNALDTYQDISAQQLADNLKFFQQEILPVCLENDISLCIHPDDPPWPIFGLPRVVGSDRQFDELFGNSQPIHNGITFCTGSLGCFAENSPEQMITQWLSRIHFLHLRNTTSEPDGSFTESGHLVGDTDMAKVLEVFIRHQADRLAKGENVKPVPFRPDHGHSIMFDQQESTRPGYTACGRLKGIAELRGLIAGILHSIQT